jgi:NADPH:quinone reductase-like Zn-dependent oxidoreductase
LVAPERTADVPDRVDDGVAVALGTAGMAAWLSLAWQARLQPGESVLVLGATRVLGSIAVQAARVLGAGRIVAAGRDLAGLRRAADRGADATVDVGAVPDLAAAFRRAAGGGVDVVIDPVWGDPALAALHAGNPFARHVQIGNAASPTMTVPAGAVRRGSASILGYTNLMVPPAERAAAYATMAGLAAAGRLIVDVEHLPLRDVQTAWALQSAVAHRKLVLVP